MSEQPNPQAEAFHFERDAAVGETAARAQGALTEHRGGLVEL